MLASVASAALSGTIGSPVAVEVHVSNGLPGFTIVGLPDAAVREARDRVRAAILSSDLPWPLRRVTVNLAPSGIRKGGAGLDLPIAIGLLVASGELPPDGCTDLAFCGELGLNGSLRHVPGMIALADAAAPPGLVVPLCDVREASLVGEKEVHGASTLAELVRVLRGGTPWPAVPPATGYGSEGGNAPDLADVRGQPLGRRALEVAAAGGHHLLMVGPPGTGKTMLAERLPGLLPALTSEEALAVTRIHSAAGCAIPSGRLIERPPFRAPHHRASVVSLIGGGNWNLRPGEVSLATHGVLFLDELGEFPVATLEALRQPLEEGVIRVSRAGGTATFPAAFQLVAAMNPCPCGEGVYEGACGCTVADRSRYRRRVSAPLLDRFDLVVPLTRPDPDALLGADRSEPSALVADRVARARRRLRAAALGEALLHPDASELLAARLRAGSLSARGLRKVERVARTVAALAGADIVSFEHAAEALSLRAGTAVVAP